MKATKASIKQVDVIQGTSKMMPPKKMTSEDLDAFLERGTIEDINEMPRTDRRKLIAYYRLQKGVDLVAKLQSNARMTEAGSVVQDAIDIGATSVSVMVGGVEITYQAGARNASGRHCGSCTLCCKLLPIKELAKAGGERCRFQRFHQAGGCKVYQTKAMPDACKLWSCRWLSDPQLTQRPDRAHYVVDILPEFIRMEQEGKVRDLQALSVWVDPGHWDAVFHDPDLRAYMDAMAHESGLFFILRRSEYPEEGVFVAPPSLTGDGWFFRGSIIPSQGHGRPAAEVLS